MENKHLCIFPILYMGKIADCVRFQFYTWGFLLRKRGAMTNSTASGGPFEAYFSAR